MRIIGTIVVASAALLTGVLTAAAAPGDAMPIITPHAFASGIDVSANDQSGRSTGFNGISDKYQFSAGFAGANSPCDEPRIQALFCRDEN